MMSLNTTESRGLLCSLPVEYPMEYFNTASMGRFTTTLKGTDSIPTQCCRITSLPRCLFFKPCFTSVSIMIILLLYHLSWNRLSHHLVEFKLLHFRITSMDYLFLGWFTPLHHVPSRKTSSDHEIMCLSIDWRCYI